jgi:CHASE2 domain-containing sensor protein
MTSAFARLRSYAGAHRVSLVLVVILAFAGMWIEERRQDFPWLITAQSAAYRVLARLDPAQFYPDRVVVVEVDDRTFRVKRFGEITDRHFLAALIRRAAAAGAAEVVLDIALPRAPADALPQRVAANHDLLSAIREAAGRTPPIPVILAVGFGSAPDGRYAEAPNAIPDANLPRPFADHDPLVGFDNAPADPRAVPLVYDAHRCCDARSFPFFSLSLRAANAYSEALRITPLPSERSPMKGAIDEGEFVYNIFLPASSFPHVSALDVANGGAALQLLAHRIVLVGGVRHDPYGNPLDVHDTPIGPMIGVYLHANRIESLLQGRVKSVLPWWVPLVVDLTLGFTMVALWTLATTTLQRVRALLLFAVPIVLAYLLFVNLRYALDFALPMLVLVGHFGIESVREPGKPKEASDAA